MNESIVQHEIEMIFNFLSIQLQSVHLDYDQDLDISLIIIKCDPSDHIQREFNRDFSLILRFLFERKHGVDENFILDINGEQRKTIESTKQKARIAAQRVRTFKKPYEFGPLSSYERMIVHSVLKQESGVETQSVGEGRDRRLFVKNKKDQ